MNELVGFRFRPTDEEIIMYFLERKMKGIDFPVHAVNEVDIRKFDPWELTKLSELEDDQVWYFFSAPSYKYANSKRTDRTTSKGTGFWKITGKDREIKHKLSRAVIGYKKTLVFHKGRTSNFVRTNWVMHEFHSCKASSYQKEFVFCRIKKKFDDKADPLQDEQSSYWPSNSGNHGALDIGPQDWVFNPGNRSAQSIVSQVNLELPMELDDEDFDELRLVMHPEEGPAPSNESNNGSNMWSSQLDMSVPGDYFVNSLLADDVDLYDDTVYTRSHGFNPTKSLRRVYVGDSSDSDTETLELQVSEAAEPVTDNTKKENSVVKLGRDQKMAQTTHAKTNLQARSTWSDSSNRKDSFISLETSPLNHKQNPPSVYIRNMVVGVFLSVICLWEMTSLH